MELQDKFDMSSINIYLRKNDHNSLFYLKATIDCFMGSKQELEETELHFVTKIHAKDGLPHCQAKELKAGKSTQYLRRDPRITKAMNDKPV